MQFQVARLGSMASILALLAPLGLAAPPARRPAQTLSAEEQALEIPQAARDLKSPVVPSEEAIGTGRKLWRVHCETCHGPGGKGDGPNARLHEARKGHAPRNLTEPDVQENLTDGEIYWRITKGIIEGDNIIMPNYEKKVASETSRWQLVLYVRQLGRPAAK